MPTQKPRFSITPSAELLAALVDLSEAVGKPMATVAAELLAEMVPQLQGLAKIAKASKAGNRAAAKRAAVHMFGDAMAEVLAMQQPDMFSNKKKGRG